MTAIYKRELKSYFNTVIGWLFIAVTIALMGVYFMAINLTYGYSNIAYMISSVAFLFIITIPILSMKTLAEERKTKTDQLILTAPVSVTKIVLGKYLAMISVLLVVIAIVSLLPIILSFYGNVPLGESYTAILGYFLYGAACMAVGLLISSMTESQVIAAVLSILVFFMTYLMSGICNLISTTGNLLTKVLNVFDFAERFNAFMGGTLDLTAVLYFVTVIGLSLFFTVQSIQKRRFSVSTKTFSLSAYNSTMMIVVSAAAVFANLMVNELPVRYINIDVTSEKLYELTDTTLEMLQNLEEEIHIYVLQSEENQDTILGETLRRYEEASKMIHVEYKDPMINPNFYQQYTTDGISMNSLIVESGQRYQVIDYTNIYETEIEYYTYSSTTTGYDGEGQITSAIDYVTKEEMPVVYSIVGHNEAEVSGSFLQAITKANVTMESINLLQYDSIPEDAEFVMIMAPVDDFSKDDANKILEYAKNGGKLFVVTASNIDIAIDMPNFQSILDYYNVTVEPGIIFESDRNYYYQSPLYLLPNIEVTSYTSDLYYDRYVFMPYAQPITVEEDDSLYFTSLLTTSDSSYAKVGAENAVTYEQEEDDMTGPFITGVLVEKTVEVMVDSVEAEDTESIEEDVVVTETTDSKLFLFTSELLFTDSANEMVSGANLTLFNNTFSSFIEEQEGSVSVPVKSYEEDYITVSQGMILLWGAVVIVMIPLALLICGIIIWARRRKR